MNEKEVVAKLDKEKNRKKIIKAIEKAGFKHHPKIYNTWRYENVLCYFAEWRTCPVFTHSSKKIMDLTNCIYKILGRKPLSYYTKQRKQTIIEKVKKQIIKQSIKAYPGTTEKDWVWR